MIYIHVPFCGSFCTYCDFYSETACRGESFEAYIRDLLGEIGARRSEIEATLGTNTLYIGGGTPSVLPFPYLERIVRALDYGPYEEFTVEVNPEDIVEKGEDYVHSLKGIGVNRVSMGVQSLDDGILKWMNRRHDAGGAEKAFGILRGCGMDNISVDVITGISGLSDGTLKSTLERIMSWRPEHVSAYQLSVEDGSALARLVDCGKYREATDEQCRRQYMMACGMLKEAGYEHYEISNWALPGRRAVHNSAYWKRLPYVGLGPAAHSFRVEGGTQTRSWNSDALCGWTSEGEVLTPGEIREEEIMLGLRTTGGWNGRVLTEEEWLVSDSIISKLV